MAKKIVIGTRASLLAVAQAETVKNMILEKYPDFHIELKTIITSGDKDQRTNWGEETSLKSLFVKEIEKELLDGKIDLAVHSMKDMPQVSPKGLINASFPIREDNRDVLVSKNNKKFSEIKKGAIIGTSSLRREISILEMYPDLAIKPIRGNIHTRLKKLDDGEFDGIILAAAGLKRVGLEERITEYIDPKRVPPAPAQGILCIQCNENNNEIKEILKSIDDKVTRIICEAEREFSRIFDGGCHTPMGCFAKIENESIILYGMYYANKKLYFDQTNGDINEPKKVAQKLADMIRRKIDE